MFVCYLYIHNSGGGRGEVSGHALGSTRSEGS